VLAAHLTFITALTIVPLLSVGLWMLSAFGLFDQSNNAELVAYIQQAFPAVASEIANYLHEFANTSAGELGIVGAIALMVVGIFLYMWVEKTFNDVWSTGQRRPWYLKILAFYAMITLGPVALTASIIITARAQIRLSHMGLDTSFLDAYLPLGLGVVVFSGLNFLMPHAKVKWYAALVAGVSSALAFEAAKWGFNLYVTELVLESYNALYGTLGLFPLFLIWLYVLWIIVLGGAELAYATQNLRTLVAVRTAESSEPQKHREHVTNPLIGLELYAPIARRFKAGEGSMPEPVLTQRSGYSAALVREVVDQMAERGLVVVVEDEEGERAVMPSKQLDDIDLLALVETFFDLEYEGNSVPMNELTQGYRALTLEVLRSRSALDLIAEHAAFQKKYGGMAPWQPIPQSVLSGEYPRVSPAQVDSPGAVGTVEPGEGEQKGDEIAPEEAVRPEVPTSDDTGRSGEATPGDDEPEGTRRLQPGRDKGNITWVGPEDEDFEPRGTLEGSPMSHDVLERPEADELPDAPPYEATTPMKESGGPALPKPVSTATFTFDDELLYPYEADLSGDEILVSDADIEAADADFRETAELDAEEVEIMDELVAELGDELSSPPPMPPGDPN
jgi:membrane protein